MGLAPRAQVPQGEKVAKVAFAPLRIFNLVVKPPPPTPRAHPPRPGLVAPAPHPLPRPTWRGVGPSFCWGFSKVRGTFPAPRLGR